MDAERLHALTEVERFERSSTENRRLLKQEELILEMTEALSAAIKEAGITRSEVAKRLGKTKGFVSQVLAGGRNLTLRTIADVADAIGISLTIRVECEQRAKSQTGHRLRRARDSWSARGGHYSISGQFELNSAAGAEQFAA